MFRFLLSLAAAFTLHGANAQNLSLCHQVIGVTGQSTTESGLHHTYTVGETVIFTLKKEGVDVVLTQGFHQPDVCLPVSTNNPEEWAGWDIQAYPNPVVDVLNVQYSAPDNSDLQGQIVSITGQVVQDLTTLTQGGTTILCSDLSAGYYVLILRHKDRTSSVSIPFSKVF